MRVQVILNIDVDPEKWAEGCRGQVVNASHVATAVSELINYSQAGYAGEMKCADITAYEINTRKPYGSLFGMRAYRARRR